MNILQIPGELPQEEQIEALLSGSTRIERIISNGQTSGWYDQSEDEWVTVLIGEGELEYEDGSVRRLQEGDTAYLPAHMRHRVSYTSQPCIWLCVFRPAEGEI